MAVNIAPEPGGGISMAPVQFTEKATVNHTPEDGQVPAPQVGKKPRQTRKPKEA